MELGMPTSINGSGSLDRLSDTGDRVVVPEIWGDDEVVALEKLRHSDLVPGSRQEEPSRSIVAGCVFGTIPPEGAIVDRGTIIAYIVAVSPLADDASGVPASANEAAA
jgi:beta-lactam-binding protein with PASTA domain